MPVSDPGAPTRDVLLTLPSGVRGGQRIIARTEFGEVVVEVPPRARAGQRLVVRVPLGSTQPAGAAHPACTAPGMYAHAQDWQPAPSLSAMRAQRAAEEDIARQREEAELAAALRLSEAEARQQGEAASAEELSLQLAMRLSQVKPP